MPTLRAGAAAWTPSAPWYAGEPPRPSVPLLFVDYLPSDNQGGVAAAAAVAGLSGALGELLCLPDEAFWGQLVHEASLGGALDSYLRFVRRPHDGGAPQPLSADEAALSRRVLFALLRAAEPPAGASDAQHSALLRRARGLLTAPQLLDAAAVYGEANEALVSRLLASSLSAAPWLRDRLRQSGQAAADNLAALAARCEQRGDAGEAERRDAAAYLLDSCRTLRALAQAAPEEAAALPLTPLLLQLQRLHARTAGALGGAGGGLAAAAVAAAAPLLLAAARDSAALEALQALQAADAVEADAGRRLLPLLARTHGAAAAAALSAGPMDAEARARAARLLAPPAAAAAAAAVAAVRELLGEGYGEGYLCYCLQALGGDAEALTGALLDGAPPAAAAGIDPGLSFEAWLAFGAAPPPARTPPRAPPPRAPPPRAPPPPRALPQAPAQPGYRKREERPRWARDEGAELLETGGEEVRSAALAAAAAQRVEEEAAAAAAPPAPPLAPRARPLVDEYDDDFDDDEGWGAGTGEAGSDSEGESPPPPPPQHLPPPPSRAAGGGGRKFWLAEGKVYTYKKEGAEMVVAASAEEAHRVGAARAAASAAVVHGLGAGGNRAAAAAEARGSSAPPPPPPDASAEPQGGAGGRAEAGGAQSFARKEKHKAAVGNHHRKDRAAAKQRVLLG